MKNEFAFVKEVTELFNTFCNANKAMHSGFLFLKHVTVN